MPVEVTDIWREYDIAGGKLIASPEGEEIFVEHEYDGLIAEHGVNVFLYGGTRLGRGQHARVIELGGYAIKGGNFEIIRDGNDHPDRRGLQQAWVDTLLYEGFSRVPTEEVEWKYPKPFFYWMSNADSRTHLRGMEYFDLPNGNVVQERGYEEILPKPRQIIDKCHLAIAQTTMPSGLIAFDAGIATDSAPHGRRLGNILVDVQGDEVTRVVKIDCYPNEELINQIPR